MAIQNRRGVYGDFDPTKMVPGEFAVVQNNDPDAVDGQSVYMAFTAGNAKRLVTDDDLDKAMENVTIDPDDLGLYQDPDTFYVYPTYKGVRSENGIPLAGGGGGGGGGSATELTLTNTSGWLSKTISFGASCEISFTWSSLKDDIPTGNGSLEIKVNEISKATIGIAQGSVSIDIGSYLIAGTNKVKAKVYDAYGNNQTIIYTVNAIELSISSSFDPTTPFEGSFPFAFTPVGAVEKTIYIVVDGSTIGTMTTSTSGRQMTYIVPAQDHGAHTLQCYYEAVIDLETVRSNELYYEFMAIESGETDVIIVAQFDEDSVSQYDTVQIPYSVYNPSALTTAVTIKVNNVTVQEVTVDRTQQIFAYRLNDYGETTVAITAGGQTKTITFMVTELDIDVEPETDSLVLYLTSRGRSNQEANPLTWTYNGISAVMTGFNLTSDCWQPDSEGNTVLRVSGDARVSIPYKPFETDFRGTGKTIELEFATRNVLNYDATILSCMSDNRGISLTAQKALLKSEQSEISTQYKEDDHVRIAFVAEKRNENRLLYIYINGIASGVVQYPTDDDFSQATPVNISIGSSDCTIDIYNIRIYDNDLTRYQILNNWIADTQSGAEMVDRYNHNNVYDEYGSIVIEKLPADLPYMIIQCPELPQYKGDKKTVSITYVNQSDATKSFTATGAQADVQGTSSQYYPRKNYKIKFKNGFVMTASGNTSPNYAMNDDAIPTNTFTFKADVASSEGANNVELVRLYNESCPYKTPAQVLNPDVRQGIDGFPIVIFWNDGSTVSFLGKYNFNNDKGTPEVFGFVDGDESWEIKNNTGNRVIWKSDDYSGTDWLNDFEARYPDTDPPYVDPTQLAEFATWVKSTDTEQATGDTLPSPVTYDDVTYTVDNAAYRLAKFRNEAGNYLEINSMLFYYLFTELFLMVDSRAKNAFPSFMGSEVNNA